WRTFLPAEDQSRIREERAFGVGLPVSEPYNLPAHYQWRPTSWLTIGAGHDVSDLKGHDLDFNTARSNLELNARQNRSAGYFQIHPLAKSGFYLGAGADYVKGTFEINKVWDSESFMHVDE